MMARRAMRRRAIVGGAIAAGAVSGARKNRAERKAIEQQTEYNEEVMNQSQNTQTAADPAEEIKKYKGMLDEGLITQEEFDAKKKQILGI